ncbi:MAG: carbohydrate kinase family protein [Clostridia bacterium]|nr:carbohydrate kinase family protein [Clostridia bacterium]
MGMLTYVTDTTYAVGGCVPNTAIDLAKIDQTIPIYALGKVGLDENGRFILAQLMKHGISVDGISLSYENVTSFCDVMSVPAGERTFFHRKGANADFAPEDIDIASLDCSILHIGYILLLDAFDKPHKEYGTVMAAFLHDVQKAGIKTSIDVVSDSEVDYAKKIIPSLKYCNYAIMNEIECCVIFRQEAYDTQDRLNKSVVRQCMENMRDCGVQDKVIVHSKTSSFVLDVPSGEFTEVPSLDLPPDCIKGSVGAGDAFCAGCLYALYNSYSDQELLDFASAAAACSLFAANSTDGMKSKGEIQQIMKKYGRLPL